MSRPELLILSFSPIAGDARVLKQVRLLSDRFAVTTCGFGEAPEGVVRHIEVPRDQVADALNGRLITLRLYDRAYWSLPGVRWVRAALSGMRFDAAIANDVEAVPLALEVVRDGRVHADLHEYTPRLHEEYPAWKRRITPFYNWLCLRYVTRAASWTTVSNGLADEYRRQFGFDARIVTNAAPWADLNPSPVGDPVSVVHSGACLRNRNIMSMVDGVERSTNAVTLDLFLTPNDPGYLEELRERARRSRMIGARSQIVLHDPVPYSELVATLNAFDLGVHVLPPVNFNNEWALPNKLFDYVQARLGVVVGPSSEMAHYVGAHGLGVVTGDFTADSLAESLDRLDLVEVRRFKDAAHAAAHEMSAEQQVHVWDDAVARLLQGGMSS